MQNEPVESIVDAMQFKLGNQASEAKSGFHIKIFSFARDQLIEFAIGYTIKLGLHNSTRRAVRKIYFKGGIIYGVKFNKFAEDVKT
jgi:hypothetical protein